MFLVHIHRDLKKKGINKEKCSFTEKNMKLPAKRWNPGPNWAHGSIPIAFKWAAVSAAGSYLPATYTRFSNWCPTILGVRDQAEEVLC